MKSSLVLAALISTLWVGCSEKEKAIEPEKSELESFVEKYDPTTVTMDNLEFLHDYLEVQEDPLSKANASILRVCTITNDTPGTIFICFKERVIF